MTSEELVDLRVRLRLSQAAFASLLGYRTDFYAGLEVGDLPIIPPVERRVRRIAAQILEKRSQGPHGDL